MLKVKDIMTKDVITVLPEMEIAHAAKLLLEKVSTVFPWWMKPGK